MDFIATIEESLMMEYVCMPMKVFVDLDQDNNLFLNLSRGIDGISNNVVCATSKASDQPAHMHSLIRTFASHLNVL